MLHVAAGSSRKSSVELIAVPDEKLSIRKKTRLSVLLEFRRTGELAPFGSAGQGTRTARD